MSRIRKRNARLGQVSREYTTAKTQLLSSLKQESEKRIRALETARSRVAFFGGPQERAAHPRDLMFSDCFDDWTIPRIERELRRERERFEDLLLKLLSAQERLQDRTNRNHQALDSLKSSQPLPVVEPLAASELPPCKDQKSRKGSTPFTRREIAIRAAIRKGKKGLDYASYLDDSEQDTWERWQKNKNNPCPKRHIDAYKDPYWRQQMQREKSRVAARMKP